MHKGQHMFGCRLCGHQIEGRAWGGGECPACGSVSVSVVPTDEELSDFYQKFNDTYGGGGRSKGENLARYARRYLQLVRRFAAGAPGELIDVGCSINPFPNFAQKAGFTTTVMDYVRPKGLDPAVRFVVGNISDDRNLQAHNLKYDTVTAWAVLEHTPDPRLACRILAGICKPGGLIFLTTPEIGTRLTRDSIGRSGWFYPPEHLHLVSPSAVRTIFEENGCSLVKWGRLELTPLRYLARYGIGCVETAVGRVARQLLPARWNSFRDTRVQKFSGITYFVLRKKGTP